MFLGFKQAHAEEVMGMRENKEKWMELCAQAANETRFTEIDGVG